MGRVCTVDLRGDTRTRTPRVTTRDPIPDGRNLFGESAYMLAVRYGHQEMADLLVQVR